MGDYQFLPIALSNEQIDDPWDMMGKLPSRFSVLKPILLFVGTVSLYVLSQDMKRKKSRKAKSVEPLSSCLEYTLTCCNCHHNVSEIVCYPCEHISLCADCDEVQICGHCFRDITSKRRIFIS
mmetsp:Transcript_62603/g.71820  ORF Transcript_62603/g.71820 Transcript_62603/m.71820 type:complete len:123 (+) Transcript_62603:546-914(+)